MPEISRFYGIVITMNLDDHPPPHFHARYGRQEIFVEIADATVTGTFPPRKLKYVRRWWSLHREELMLNWRLREQDLQPRYIEPLE